MIDLRSSNGTWVDGNRLTPNKPYPLRDRQECKFGDARGGSLEVATLVPADQAGCRRAPVIPRGLKRPREPSAAEQADPADDHEGARGQGAWESNGNHRRPGCVLAPAANVCAQQKGPAKCDKCDGPHTTEKCPHFKKAREDHKDAWVNYGNTGKTLSMGSSGGNYVLRNARHVRQPGDGSCLYHSLNFGLRKKGSAEALRRELADYIFENPKVEISGDTLEEWVRWDTNSSVGAYCRRMAQRGQWGGGIEMAACSLLKHVNVHVYENLCRSSRSCSSEFKRISCFDSPNATRTVHVLYQGGVHYDALVPLVAT